MNRWHQQLMVKINCFMDFSAYPLDTQTCSFQIASARHLNEEIYFVGKSKYSASLQEPISYSVKKIPLSIVTIINFT